MKQSGKFLETALNKATRISDIAFDYRQTAIARLRALPDARRKEWDDRFQELAVLEADLEPYLEPTSEDLKALREDALGQLSFQDEWFRCLNYVPWALTLIALFKIWAVPAMAIASPLFAWLLPYLFLKFLYQLPISTEQYSEILGALWSGNPMQFKPGPEGFMPPRPSMWTSRSIVQTLFMGFSFIQSLVQPIQNARHLWKTDRNLQENGRKVLRVRELYGAIIDEVIAMQFQFPFRNSLKTLNETDPRQAIVQAMEQPARMRLVYRDIAELEVLWRIAQTPALRPVVILESSDKPLFVAEGLRDLTLGDAAVASSLRLTNIEQQIHAVLTGPNGGGKSSFLRAILQAVLFAQVFGVAPADSLTLRRFAWIQSGLRLQDAPGELSMFETEVAFAAELLRKADRSAPGLVLYDELFHSTNPPDGTRTAELFLSQLWNRAYVASVVSTHVFSLIDTAPTYVQRICCQATEAADGDVTFRYEVEPGVCTVSSVRTIWKRFGLLRT